MLVQIFNCRAALSGKVVQHVLVAHCCQQDSQLRTQYQKDCCTPYRHKLLPYIKRKLAWTQVSSMQLRTFSKFNRGIVYCNAASSATIIQPVDKGAFLKLQNGSDIRGVAVDGVEGEPVSLTEPVTEAIATAFAAWLLDRKKPDASRRLKVSIGHDSRISAQKLQDAVSRGLAGAGVDVIQYGLASTPAMFNSVITKSEAFLCPVDGSIMITASHLPYNRNGFKFFTDAGGLGKVDIKEILERAADIHKSFTDESLRESEYRAAQCVKRVDYMSVYTSDLVKAVQKAAGNKEKPLEGFHIVVDAGNGAGGFFAGKVLEPLGAITSGRLFPNHIPNPEDKEAMKAITRAVLDNKADLGIIFDTDVDRSAAVDSSGRGKHHRFKRGYKNVIDEAIRLNSFGEESHLAIETSGHGALKENHWLDDGAYLMVKLLNKLASAKASGVGQGTKVLTDMVDGLDEPGFAIELRLKIDQNDADLNGGIEVSGLSNVTDGSSLINAQVRVSGYGGWFLLRLSLHDPVLPLNIEAPSNEEAVKLGLAVLSAVREFHAIDTSALDKFVQV
ncbi:phosphoglucosamine mutase [Phtheirospermum japonicum]|uniref:Phosphoglucosamine mutase n=1 Tax=Phtheirospermum japonicum TaxID=374723 RepID=A0A830C9X9_9LAMI|nr:phosphoglucosamine mutase [Phtheirospermum japonicum]